MATRKNENGNLESAMALLIQNQAEFLTHLTETRLNFASLKTELDLIKQLLLQHDRILKDLPEKIREKIGFNPT